MSPGDFLGEFLITEPGEPAPINPTGLVWGPDGDLFVASCGSHNVIRYRGFIANRATISGNSNPPNNPNDPNLSNNTGTVAVWVQGADLEVEKTVDDNTPDEGDTVIYTITVTNHGPKDAIDVHATDVLPPQLTYVSSTASQGTYTPGTGDWNVGALAFDENTGIGAEATLDIVATVNPGVAAANPIVTNTVTVDDLSPMIGDPDTRNNTASVPIFLVFADLAVTKSVDLPIADEGQTVEFTITVTNNGEDDATGVQIRDRVPSGMAFVSATTPPGTTYNPVSGIWNIGSLPDGAMRTLLLRGQVLSGTGGQVLTNVATVAATSLPDPDLSNDTATADVSVRGADLSIDKTVTPGPYAFGTPVTFTIVVTNNGPLNAVGVTARDRLPVGLTYVSHTASGGTYDPISGVWTIGALANGASRTLTINATFSSAASESATNIATVTALTGDQDLNNNRDAVVLGVPNIDLDIIIVSRPAAIYPDPAESAAALELARDAHDAGEGGDTAPADAVEGPDAPDAADPDAETPRPPLLPGPAVAGNGLFYDITVRNDGTSIATGVVLTLMLDVDVHYVTDNNVPQCVEAPVGFLTCQFGSIPPGGSKTITVQTEVEPDAYYTRLIAAQPLVLTLRAGVTADQDDTDILNDTEVHLTHLVDLADTRIWKISKPDDGIRAGEIFTYTLLVENLGPSHARDLAIDDTLLSSGAFTLVGTLLDPARNDACTVAPAPPPLSGQILRCTLVEPLEPVGSGFRHRPLDRAGDGPRHADAGHQQRGARLQPRRRDGTHRHARPAAREQRRRGQHLRAGHVRSRDHEVVGRHRAQPDGLRHDDERSEQRHRRRTADVDDHRDEPGAGLRGTGRQHRPERRRLRLRARRARDRLDRRRRAGGVGRRVPRRYAGRPVRPGPLRLRLARGRRVRHGDDRGAGERGLRRALGHEPDREQRLRLVGQHRPVLRRQLRDAYHDRRRGRRPLDPEDRDAEPGHRRPRADLRARDRERRPVEQPKRHGPRHVAGRRDLRRRADREPARPRALHLQ
ncbi:MAG: DUF11 domain-containing protein [Ardenticatenales bacterium]|nr:DUF11 domain-containing protein [Ardenticatenales bacterium]